MTRRLIIVSRLVEGVLKVGFAWSKEEMKGKLGEFNWGFFSKFLV